MMNVTNGGRSIQRQNQTNKKNTEWETAVSLKKNIYLNLYLFINLLKYKATSVWDQHCYNSPKTNNLYMWQ